MITCNIFVLFISSAPGVEHVLHASQLPTSHSGASHGGSGGRGACDGFKSCRLKRNIPYGNMYYPTSYGSGGANPRGGIGKNPLR